MADIHIAEIFAELVRRGLVAPTPPPAPLSGGNADRRAENVRLSWQAHLPDGRTVRLTLGPKLSAQTARQAAFARACPTLVPELLFFVSLAQGEAAAEEFFEGVSIEQAGQSGSPAPEKIQAAFARACSILAATEEASSEEARRREWREWSASLTQLSFWTPLGRSLLEEQILPRLYARLAVASPATRWSNGDFISANLLVAPGGETRLIDLEFAARTHFHAEDAVRFHVLSSIARAHPEWFSTVQPLPGPAWHLYFWLRQLGLEATNNTPEYLAGILPVRLALIRRLAEQTLGVVLTGWATDALAAQAQVEEARWVSLPGAAVKFSGWCHVPEARALRAICLFADNKLLAETPLIERSDVQRHFAGEPRALSSGFTLTARLTGFPTELVICAQTNAGALLPFRTVNPEALPGRGPTLGDYARWAAQHDPDPPSPATVPDGPRFSILLPVYNTPAEFLRTCLASVRAQHYPRWELCVVDDASPAAHVGAVLREAAAADARIRVQTRATNGGIARATNDALAMARGEFIVLLDHDDLLRPHALLEFARRLATEPSLDALYSDEGKITAEGQLILPIGKPDFSPEFLLGVMYIGHALSVRTTVARATGGFDSTYDGVQDYEFFLRVTERTRRIGHIDKMLYHWRQSPGSSALQGNVKGNMDEKQAAAVRAHLRRTGRSETAVPLSEHRVRLAAGAAPAFALVRPVAGESAPAALRRAAAVTAAEVLVLLGTEVQAPTDDWPRELAALAMRPDSGCVAPVLVSPTSRVIEAGCTLTGGRFVRLMQGFDASGDGYNGSLRCTREVAAVSPICIAVRRTIASGYRGDAWQEFLEVLRKAGLYHRVAPAVQLTVGNTPPLPENASVGAIGFRDPFYNRHFAPDSGDYRLRDDFAPSTSS
ncbi:MAG: glycosyltransferase [Opitutae bacterium]|nr:glycosyltransferase [Opitutae bacterium]